MQSRDNRTFVWDVCSTVIWPDTRTEVVSLWYLGCTNLETKSHRQDAGSYNVDWLGHHLTKQQLCLDASKHKSVCVSTCGRITDYCNFDHSVFLRTPWLGIRQAKQPQSPGPQLKITWERRGVWTRSATLFLSHLLFHLRCCGALDHTANKIRMLGEPHSAGSLCVRVFGTDLITENSCKTNYTENSTVCGRKGGRGGQPE